MNEAKKYFIISLLVIVFVSGIFALILVDLNDDIDILFDNDIIFQEFQNDLLLYLENEYPSYMESDINEGIIDPFMDIQP